MAEARRALGEGAAQEAPTAPHATPRKAKGPRTGPERFWAHGPMRVALAACLVISGVAHCTVFPIDVSASFEVKDVEGEAAIPIDILAEDTPAPEPPAPAPPVPNPTSAEDDKGPQPALLPPARRDAGAPRDGGVDAAADAPSDGSPDARLPRDASDDIVEPDGPIPLVPDGGVAAASGPRDPQAIIGAAGSVQADVVLVMVVVNAEVIRKNPVGAKMGYLLRGIPQWDDFMSGTEIDPVRDTDWVMISGPSLVNTSRDVVMIHYSAPDAVVDKAVSVVSKKYDRGGPIDAGVPGVKATLAHADRAERVMIRPQPHVLAVVPPSVAEKVARQLVASKVPAHVRPGEALYLRLVNPHHPMPQIPETITEARLRVVPRASDDGADVHVDGDTKDAETAAAAAQDVKRLVESFNTGLTGVAVRAKLGDILDRVEVTTEGSRVHVHLSVTRDEIDQIVYLVGALVLQVQPGGSVVPPAPSAPTKSQH
jgi:hypothetical protein